MRRYRSVGGRFALRRGLRRTRIAGAAEVGFKFFWRGGMYPKPSVGSVSLCCLSSSGCCGQGVRDVEGQCDVCDERNASRRNARDVDV